MSWQDLDSFLLALAAAFAAGLTNPVLVVFVVVAALRSGREWPVRLVALAIGLGFGFLDLAIELTGRRGVSQPLGCALAALLWGEFMLQLVLPLWRLVRRLAAWLGRWFSSLAD